MFKKIKLIDLIFVLVLGSFFCLYKLEQASLPPGDSSVHSLVVQTMVKTGDFLHPRLISQPYYNKPPFKFWLTAFVVKLFGESNLSYRIIDGLIGIALVIMVFYFSLSLFRSRAISYFSMIALLGTHILFFGHGIRDAVQDPMMIFLMSLGTMCGWFLIEETQKNENLKEQSKVKIRKLAILGGILIGLSTITKSVVGLYSLVIIFFFLLIDRQLLKIIKKIPKDILIVIFLSLVFLPLYVISQWGYIDILIKNLFYKEIYYRATKGFHYVNHQWFYWHVFFRHKQVVPAVLFIIGSIFSTYKYIKCKDRRHLFLLCWAIVPLFFQNIVKSKLRWYILPAVPGIVMIVGYLLGTVYQQLRENLPNIKNKQKLTQLKTAFLSMFFIFSCYQLSYHLYQVVDDILETKPKHAVEKISTALKEYGFKNNKQVNLVYYKCPELVSYELFYFGMMPLTRTEASSLEEVKALIEQNKVDFVVTNGDNFEKLLSITKPSNYIILPKEDHRPRRLFFMGYNPEIIAPRLKPIAQVKEDL